MKPLTFYHLIEEQNQRQYDLKVTGGLEFAQELAEELTRKIKRKYRFGLAFVRKVENLSFFRESFDIVGQKMPFGQRYVFARIDLFLGWGLPGLRAEIKEYHPIIPTTLEKLFAEKHYEFSYVHVIGENVQCGASIDGVKRRCLQATDWD